MDADEKENAASIVCPLVEIILAHLHALRLHIVENAVDGRGLGDVGPSRV